MLLNLACEISKRGPRTESLVPRELSFVDNELAASVNNPALENEWLSNLSAIHEEGAADARTQLELLQSSIKSFQDRLLSQELREKFQGFDIWGRYTCCHARCLFVCTYEEELLHHTQNGVHLYIEITGPKIDPPFGRPQALSRVERSNASPNTGSSHSSFDIVTRSKGTGLPKRIDRLENGAERRGEQEQPNRVNDGQRDHNCGAHGGLMPQHHHALPPILNMRSKNSLINIDQFLEQMQSTVYDNSNSVAGPGVQQLGPPHEGENGGRGTSYSVCLVESVSSNEEVTSESRRTSIITGNTIANNASPANPEATEHRDLASNKRLRTTKEML
jgi:hypothetical protein